MKTTLRAPPTHPQKVWAPLQVSAVDKLVSRGFSEPSSSVRRTGVPALSLHPGVRATAARTKEFPPRDGSFYQPAEQPTAVWRPQRSMNRFLFLQHLEASSQCFCADRIAAVCCGEPGHRGSWEHSRSQGKMNQGGDRQ